jgi:hypothetical protein
MIYWFFKDSSVSKTELPKRFLSFLQTEKRNWRKDVFYVDYETASKLIDLSKVNFTEYCTMMANYIHYSKCDIVICSDEVEEFYIDANKIIKVHLYPKKGEIINEQYQLSLCVDTPNQSFNKLIQYINEL